MLAGMLEKSGEHPMLWVMTTGGLPMKRIALATIGIAMTGMVAEARPMSSAMRCADVQRMVARSGAVVMNFTPTTYDRVVLDQRFCLPTEGLVRINVPTRDTPYCFAGYTCREGATILDWN
jgi:hypothetical protein